MNRRSFLVILGPALAWPHLHAVADGWREVARDDDGSVIVSLRPGPRGTSEFLGVTRMRTSLSALVALLLDRNKAHEWSYGVRRAETISVDDDNRHGVTRILTRMPPLVADRDVVFEWRIEQEADGTVVVTSQARSGLAPEDPDYVRMPAMVSQWRFRPLESGFVEVRFQGHGHLGGAFTSPPLEAIANQLAWKAPFETLRSMQGAVAAPAYRDARVEFIREPAGGSR